MSNLTKSENTKQRFDPEDLKQVWYMHWDPYGPVRTSYLIESGTAYLQPVDNILDHYSEYGSNDYLKEPGLYACEDGVYEWNEEKQDYDFVGGIIKIIRKKKVVMRCDLTVNGTIHLKQNEEYEVKKEYITYHNDAQPDVIYVLQGKGTDLFELAYDEEIQKLLIEDLALIHPKAHWHSMGSRMFVEYAEESGDPIPF